MQTAHELAQLAAQVAGRMQHTNVAWFRVEHTSASDVTRVILGLTSGTEVWYILTKEKEVDRPAGQSLPDSPSQ